MPTPTLTIAGTNQLPYVLSGSMSLKYNTLDVTLTNPASTPAVGTTVEMTNPTWSGTVVAVTTTDLTERKGSQYMVVTISATNEEVAAASAAPFNLSDTPNNTTTFGYRELSIQTSINTDGTTTTNGSCIVYQEGLWPGMTFQLTSSNQGYSSYDFSVQNVTVDWLTSDTAQYHIEFGDPIVTMSVWLNENASDFILPIDETKITDGAVTTPKIYTNAITTDKIDAKAITADKLAAELILASKIKTAESGMRVEIDTDGIRNYSSGGDLLVNIPTTGTDPVSVTGKIEASQFVSTESATLQGTNVLAKGSVTTLEVGVTNPNVAPTIVSTLESLPLTSTPTYMGHGLCYDSAGDSGGATATYWIGADPTASGSTDVAYEFNASTGVLLRTIQKTGTTTTSTTTLGGTGHVSDTSQAYSGASNSQIATPLTMPRDGTITKVSGYFSGYLGDATCRVAIWDTSGNSLRESASSTVSQRTFSNGNDTQHNWSLSSPLSVSSGTTIWAGFLHTSSGEGFFYSRDDGSSKTTKRGDGLAGDMTGIETDSASKPNVYITYTYTVDSSLEGTMGKIIGVARQGTYIWVLDSLGTLFRYNQSDLSYVDKFTGVASYITGTKANAGLFWNGTHLVITTASGVTATEVVVLVKVNTSGAFVSTHDTAGLAINGGTATIRGGYYDSTNYWISINGTVYAYSGSTYAIVDDRNFGLSAETSSGVTYDGTVFRGWSQSNPTKIWKYTSWDWTTESAVYWIGYAWYDSAGTTHETALSPRSSITLGRRRRITITNPAIPTGGADDPDKVRVYMLRNATEPAAGSYEMQIEDAATTRTLETYTTVNGLDATSNDFPAGTAATLASSSTGWTLKGDGKYDFYVRGGKYSGTTAVTLSTSMQKLDLVNTLDGESAYLIAASDRVQIPTDAGGLYRVQASVKTPTGLTGTTNLRVAIYIDGAEVGFHPFNPTVAATTGGAVAHWEGVVAASSYIEVFAQAGSGVSGGTAQVMELVVMRLGVEWAA
jgi:hypothetical protein